MRQTDCPTRLVISSKLNAVHDHFVLGSENKIVMNCLQLNWDYTPAHGIINSLFLASLTVVVSNCCSIYVPTACVFPPYWLQLNSPVYSQCEPLHCFLVRSRPGFVRRPQPISQSMTLRAQSRTFEEFLNAHKIKKRV